jgi:hypothetical protein
MIKWLISIGLLILATQRSWSVPDPLSSQFQPGVDKDPTHYISTITISGSLFKVFQSSPSPSTDHWIQVYLMQNETQSFQVHVTPDVNITSLTVSMSNLVDTQTVPSTIIYATSTDIVVYREFYLHITTPTALSSVTYSSGFRAWMPDQLIPAVDPYWHQTTNAFPVAVKAGNTQSAWVDVHIPTTAPSGYYSGSVYVSSGAVVVSTMPVVYAVWSWLMPSTSTLGMIGSGFGYNGFCNVAYGGTANCGNYPDSGGGADGANTMQFIDGSVQMLDNRWTIDTPGNDYPQSGSFATYNSHILPLINGTASHVPRILPGSQLNIVGLQALSFTGAVFQNWVSSSTDRGWFTNRLMTYPCDEPSAAGTWTVCKSSMTASRGYSTPVVPNQVTTDMTDALTQGATNMVDWMTPIVENVEYPGLANQRSTYDTWLTTNAWAVPRRVGSYQDCESAGTCGQGTIGPANTPTFPNRHVDGKPVANRAFESYLFRNNYSYQLYFAVDLCDNVSAGYPCAGATSMPWTTVYAFGCNGDGTLIYPSSPTYVSFTASQSTPIWVPSMRLKYYRDGEQDYEYENYLTSQGSGTYVNQQIDSWMTNAYTFSVTTAPIETARFNMGQAIHQLTYPAGGGGGGGTVIKSFSGGGKFKGGGTIR